MGNCWSCTSTDTENSHSTEDSFAPNEARELDEIRKATHYARISLDRPKLKALFAIEASAITLRNLTDSPFLRLPLELRAFIYIYVLSYHRDCCCDWRVVNDILMHQCDLDSMYTLTSITRTCRQTHAESGLIFFEINCFGAHDHNPALHRWELLNECTKQQRKSIKHWWIEKGYIANVTDLYEPFDLMPKLQTVTFVSGLVVRTEERDADEARVRQMVCASVGRELRVLFVYELDGVPVDD